MGVLALLLCCYIMAHGLGLVPELDFGAGAYYYADIPEFQNYTDPAEASFTASLPLWVYILLFLCWGYLMWRLWVWMDSRK